ncbi:hypothetical protein OsI_06858 [Oryza sativa Indica Group]|uniref:Uncharacterized protein n=1 Tax=Oryza sativa subsp. indica TaxID=39946 RepID=B8AFX4_ORYSI|nr:hypothetical protein OsI_06858 [Oryza sativa Indica Group]
MTSTSASEAETAGRRGEVADPVPLRLDLAPRSGQCGNNNPGTAAARWHDGDGVAAWGWCGGGAAKDSPAVERPPRWRCG